MTSATSSGSTLHAVTDPGTTGTGGAADAAVTAPSDDVLVLGLVAAFELATFARLAADADVAPSLQDRVLMVHAAAAAVQRQDRLVARLVELGADPIAAIAPFADALDDFDARTPPTTWWERLLKAYVGYGVADDFCGHLANGLADGTRDLVLSVLDDASHTDMAATALAAGCRGDDVLVSRLALWGRRLVGEALGVVQTLLAGHPELLRLANAEQSGAGDHAPKLFGQLTQEHTRRMTRLGFTA